MSENKNLPVMGNWECFLPISENYPNIKSIEFIEFIPILNKYQLNENKWDVSDAQNGSIMAWTENDTLKISGNGPVLANENCADLFFEFMEVEKICFNGLFDTCNVNIASGMFNACHSLKYVEVANWDTKNLGYVEDMFWGCEKLECIDLSGWNTNKLRNISDMFKGCLNLLTIDLSNWDTQNLVYAWGLFNSCEKLKTVDLSNWNTQNLENASGMFCGCKNLEKVITSNECIIEEIKEERHSASIIQAPKDCSVSDKMKLMQQGISIKTSQNKDVNIKEQTLSKNNQDISR